MQEKKGYLDLLMDVFDSNGHPAKSQDQESEVSDE